MDAEELGKRVLYGRHWDSAKAFVTNVEKHLTPGTAEFNAAVEKLASARAAHSAELDWRARNHE